MFSPAITEPVEIKNRDKTPSNNNVPDTQRINNISRLISPPQGQNIQLSKSQPSIQNKPGTSPDIRLSASGGYGRSFGSLEHNSEAIPIDIPDERKVEIVRKHLVTEEDFARSAENGGSSTDPLALYSTSHHKLRGLDATHEVYKWHNNIEIEPMKRTRSRSLYIPRPTDPDMSNIREPGGFRRHHMMMKARQEGKELPNIITRNFIDFLAMYGHFAGEDLSDDEEDKEDDIVITEMTPLLQREIPTHATASPSKAIIPITESMKEPEKFPKVLTGVMIFITIIFTSIGVLSYAAFGKEVQTVVILNLPPNDPLVRIVQLLYALAILLSVPLQLFPAIRIMEQGIFERSGKDNLLVKWQKNLFRFLTVVACGLIAWGGASDLDKFEDIITEKIIDLRRESDRKEISDDGRL
ncbi:1864_t:CDS:2, partial [Racocetra fulgida]